MRSDTPQRKRSPGEHFDTSTVFGERLFTTKELALALGLKETTIREWIAEGDLPAAKFGKQYLISESVLKRAKQDKEDEQRRKAVERRQEREFKAELDRRRHREPDLHWEPGYCLKCGQTLVFTTRYGRLDGDVICEACAETVRDQGLSKEGWRRRVSVRVAELNSIHQEEQAIYPKEFRSDEPPWTMDECGYCGKPYALSWRNLDDPSFLPDCDHSSPFPDPLHLSHGQIHPDFWPAVIQTVGEKQLDRLISTETDRRNSLEESYSPCVEEPWGVNYCVSCGLRRAVADTDRLRAGAVVCRLCVRGSAPINPHKRARMVRWNALPFYHLVEQGCACGGIEMVDTAPEHGVVLSWCAKRERRDLAGMANRYARRLRLSYQATQALLASLPGVSEELGFPVMEDFEDLSLDDSP